MTMDRYGADWPMVERGYRTHALGEGPAFPSAREAIEAAYLDPDVTDQTVPPFVIHVDGAPCGRMADGDGVLLFNFRGDRAIQISMALSQPGFDAFDVSERPDLLFVGMMEYDGDRKIPSNHLVAPPDIDRVVTEYLVAAGRSSLAVSETQKFGHVTFFFNDYRDQPFAGETREIVQSPKVATYDMQPEMSAAGVRDAVLRRLDANDCEDVIVVNFANGDMVGHTGSLEATVKACETVDACVGAIVDKALARGGRCIVTADHGNAEQMWDPASDAPHTAHTTYTVPAIVVAPEAKGRNLRTDGRLGDLVPTMLELMGLDKPADMTGRSLML